MALNILKAGFALTVSTRTAGKAEQFAAQHKSCKAGTIADVARVSDVVVICVTDSPDVEAVARGGLFANARAGTVIIVSSPPDCVRVANTLFLSGHVHHQPTSDCAAIARGERPRAPLVRRLPSAPAAASDCVLSGLMRPCRAAPRAPQRAR